MFKGNYGFFDYKYNIIGYNGQDYGSLAQYLYLIISIILLVFLLIVLRKLPKNKILNIIRFVSIFLILFYIGKTTWESIYDIKLNGKFNTGLLPFDTCSIIMLAGLLAGFAKGKIKKTAECWIATGSIIGGVGTMLYLNAFKYYPFLSFGAFYSMIWHFLMVFLGLLLIVTNYVEINFNTVKKGFIFHFLISIFVIPIDFIFDFDFMLYKNLGGIPIFEDFGSILISKGLGFINPIMMLVLYFLAFSLIISIPMLIKKLRK